MSTQLNKIAVFTSGGDSPGMNAAIRAVVRAGIHHGFDVYGIMRGYEGMIDGDIRLMGHEETSGIIQRGGTVLKSARSMRFMTTEGRKLAYQQLQKHGINALVAIGGDGTFTGGQLFTTEYPDLKYIGLPGTIDNDLYGTDLTIGYDTALNTVVEAVDKIRDTAESHDRLFFIEVMGKDAGFIALRSGIATGADAILVPEFTTDLSELVSKLHARRKKGKSSSIVIVAEGDDAGGAFQIVDKIKNDLAEFEIKVSILGHMQRGGNPSCVDRVLASRMGVAAVDALVAGKSGVMIGQKNNEMVHVPLEKAIKYHETIDPYLVELSNFLGS